MVYSRVMQGGWQGGPPPQGGTGGYGAPPSAGLAPPPPGTYPAGYGPPQAYGAYEFNELENAILARTASRAKLWGVISAVLGGVQILGSCGMVASSQLGLLLPLGLVAMIVGMVFVGVGNSLDAVVRTRGHDLPHLMQAMQKLSTAFTVQIVCNVIGVVLFAVLMVFFFFAAVLGAASH